MTLQEVQQMMESQRLAYVESFNRRHPNWVYPICCVCNQVCDDPYGHNAQPYADGRCCSNCNNITLRCRISQITEEKIE